MCWGPCVGMCAVCLCILAWEGAASAGMGLSTRLLPWQALNLVLMWWFLVKIQALKFFFVCLSSDVSTDKLHSPSQEDLLHTDTLQPDRAQCGDLHPGNHQRLPAETVQHKPPSSLLSATGSKAGHPTPATSPLPEELAVLWQGFRIWWKELKCSAIMDKR